MVEIVSTANDEVDRQIGGGLPLPMMMIVEGDNGTGKSALIAQFMWGMLQKGMKILLISDNNVKNYLEKMKTITYDFSKYFLRNQITILPMHAFGTKWSKKQSKYLLPLLLRYLSAKKDYYDVVVIDPFSLLAMYANADTVLDFFTRCKHLVTNGTSIILTTYKEAIPEEVALQMKSTSDGYLRLKKASIAGQEIRISEVVKLAGSTSQVVGQFSFDVNNYFGIKIVPLSVAG